MDKTIGALRDIFLALHRAQKCDSKTERKKGRHVSHKAQATKEWLQNYVWLPIQENELEKELKGPNELIVDFSARKKVLYLPLLEKDAEYVPVLSFTCHLSEDKSTRMMKLSIMLVCKDDDEMKKPFGVGFRIESPHGKEYGGTDDERDGRHDFHHAQFINDLGYGKSDIDSPTRLPCSQPSFPLTARDPVTLVLSLLLTLYGKNYCLDFYKDNSELRGLKQYMDKLHQWIDWKGL